MIETNVNHCEVVTESLGNKRAVDEQTFASLAILEERLERLRRLHGLFDKVRFSPAVRKLRKQSTAVAVG
ncbi:MAG: hypothetical protein ACYTBJ_23720 [Planctomycetota bacterium]|jgi:hypothetical protein